ncbi:MAG: TonB-dependent receptor plug domain-containing protein, partial [Salibacteraceae bacterium]
MKRVLPFLLLPFASIAQDTNELRSVIISDNRIETSIMESGRNVQVLTQDQIETMPAQNLNDLLQHIAGVDF